MNNITYRIPLLLVLATFLVSIQTAIAQVKERDESRMIQLSGVVVSEEEAQPLSYTTVYDLTLNRGVMADYQGYFSLVVFPGDTLFFDNYSYKQSTFIVPDSLTDRYYSIIHMMQRDTVKLDEVTVYPWPTREDFARYFVEMDVTDDALRRAQRELSGESLAFVAARTKVDAGLAQAYSRNQTYTALYTRGQVQGLNLLNPYAWSKLVTDWKKGKLKRE